jgi:hypothetical protein
MIIASNDAALQVLLGKINQVKGSIIQRQEFSSNEYFISFEAFGFLFREKMKGKRSRFHQKMKETKKAKKINGKLLSSILGIQ